MRDSATPSDTFLAALESLSDEGAQLASKWHFDWPEQFMHVVDRLRFSRRYPQLPALTAIVGGASSGKSTIFDNLMEGRLTSRITARGHVTLGLICAVHEDHRATIDDAVGAKRLFRGLDHHLTEPDDNTTGSPDKLAVRYHQIDALRNAVIFDTPDFTTEAARREGDVVLTMLPWFDRLVVVADYERWFDRQSFTKLRAESSRLGQQRMVVFNRTRDITMGEADRARLDEQKKRLLCEDSLLLNFRRGRGLNVFPPGTFDRVVAFASQPRVERDQPLQSVLVRQAQLVLSQNDERAARLKQLDASIEATLNRVVPSERSCLTALMMPAERAQLEPLSRILRLHETREWFSAQTQRLRSAARQIPLFGSLVTRGVHGASAARDETDRVAGGMRFFESQGQRVAHEIDRVVLGSAFWDEVQKWTQLAPQRTAFAWTPHQRDAILAQLTVLDARLTAWFKRIETEGTGVAPVAAGGITGGSIGVGWLLLLEPITASTVLAVALVGAAVGKPAVRLISTAREKLLDTPEHRAVHQCMQQFRSTLDAAMRELAHDRIREAHELVMPAGHPLSRSLEMITRFEGESP